MHPIRTLGSVLAMLLTLVFAQPARAQVNICWDLVEPIWVPPTPLDAAECTEKNWHLCFVMPHCCLPTCRLHPECVLGGTFVDGHWKTLECRMMDPNVALEQFLRGLLRPVDDFLEPIRQAAVIQINGLMAFGRPIPNHVQTLINTLMGSDLMAGQPQFRPGHVARTLLLPERQPTADLYLPNPATNAITLDNLVIMRNASFDAIYNEPVRTADDFFCGRVSPAFANAVRLLMHELVHVRQWEVLGRDTFLNNYLLEVLSRGYPNDSFEREAFALDNFVRAQLGAPNRSEAHGWLFSNLADFSETRILDGSVNSAGGAASATKTGVGTYDLTFDGLSSASFGNVQVTAGMVNRYCKPSVWQPSGSNVSISVACFDASGNPADSTFFASVESIVRGCQGTSYLWADRTTGSFNPNGRYSHSQSLTSNSVTRTAVGRFTATMPGISGSGGNAQVNAYGSGPARCQITNWALSRGTASINIACFNPDGTPVDARFSLRFSQADVVGRSNALAMENAGAYLWADNPDSTEPYAPASSFRFSHLEDVSVFEPPTVGRLSAGRYRASLPGYASEFDRAALLLSPYGAEDRICSITGRSSARGRAQIDVECTNHAGVPSDSRWTLMFGTNTPAPF